MESEELLPELPEYSEEFLPNNPEELSPDQGVSVEIVSNVTEVSHEIQEQQEDTENKEPQDKDDSTTASDKPAEKSNEPRLTQLPISRIRNLMKLDPDFNIASMESVFLVTKATEMFIDSLAKESFVHTTQAKKKTVQKRDVDLAISSVDSLMFLEGAMNF